MTARFETTIVASGYDVSCPNKDCDASFTITAIPRYCEGFDKCNLMVHDGRPDCPGGNFITCPECLTDIQVLDWEHAYD